MIIVTGATGHIGNVLVRTLVENGKKVRAVLAPGESGEPLKGLNIERVEANVLDSSAINRAFEGGELLFHLAGIISITSENREKTYRVNVEGTENVLRAAKRAGIKKMVYTSSVHALSEPPRGSLVDEALPFDPKKTTGNYGKSKAMASLKILNAVKDGLDATLVCPTGVIGPYDYRLSQMGKLFIDFAKKKMKFCVSGSYDFVDVRDVVDGTIKAAEKGKKGGVYLLGGNNISMREIMKILSEVSGVKPPRIYLSGFIAGTLSFFSPVYYSIKKTIPCFTSYSIHTLTRNYVISHEKATAELDYKTRSPLESIRDSLRWFSQRGMISQTIN